MRGTRVPVERKRFRIEEMGRDGFAPAGPADEAASRHAEVMVALTSLRALITASGPHRVGETTPDALPSTLADTARRTAREIAALRDHGFASMTRAAQELAAIVQGTEQATQRILQASE